MKIEKLLTLTVIVVLIFILQISLATANSYPYSVITVGNSVKSVDSTSAIVCGYVTLSGKYSTDVDGTIELHKWMENGKTIGESKEVTLYIKDTTTKIITLEVTDNEGGTGKSEIVIYADSNAEPKIEDVDTNINNDDLCVYLCQQFEVSACIDTDDKIEVVWDYDKRIFQQIGESKVYRDKYQAEFMVLENAISGNSKVRISAIDTCGQKDEEEISIKVLLSKKLEIEKINVPYIEEGKRFSVSADINTEEELKFFWTLADLSRNRIVDTSNRESPMFRLSDEGFYEIKLTITNACGDSFSDFETFEIESTQDDLPVADASRTAKIAILHVPFILDGSKSYDDSDITRYDWFAYNKARGRYERICSNNQPFCNYTFHQAGKKNLYLIVKDDKEPMPHQKSKLYYFNIRVKEETSMPTQLTHTPQPTCCYIENQHYPTPKTSGMGFGSAVAMLIIVIAIRRKKI